MLERAISIATEAHTQQVDKGGEPYILHPLRVMLSVEGELERVVAVLHDVVEDSAWTLDGLRAARFPRTVVEAIDCLTRRDGETYAEFIQRCDTNDIARLVKVADIKDNLSPTRENGPSASLRTRYVLALRTLLSR